MFPFSGLAGVSLPEPPPEPEAQRLFTSTHLGSLEVPNRIAMAPMGTGFASPQGRPTARLIAWYAARAAGGAGLIIVEGAQVTPLPEGEGQVRARRRLSLAADDAVSSFRRLAAAIRRAGARAAIQLTHTVISPDEANKSKAAEIEATAAAFGAAARRAKSAGFEAVEVQASFTSLLAQLLSPATNRRRDRFGRTPSGRQKALVDAVRAIRKATGPEFPIVVRISADEYLPRGLTPDQATQVVRALEAAGATAVDVIAGAIASDAALPLSHGVGEATLAPLAGQLRRSIALPVLAGGRVVSSYTAETMLGEGQADVIAAGRALLADPAWPAKIRAGIEFEVIPCIGCLACFTPGHGGGIGCPVNGEAGHEYLPPLAYAERPRRVAVLGTSLAALELARVATTRGHQVEVIAAGLPLGGLLGLRAGVPGNAEFGRAFLYFGERLGELGVGIGEPSGLPQLADVVVDCRPAPEARPSWAAGKGVLFAGEVLSRDLHQFYGLGRRVAVVGDGALAAEMALFLAGWGRRPTVIVTGGEDDPFFDVHPMHAFRLRERMTGYQVSLVGGADALRWQYDADRRSTLVVRRHDRERVLGPFQSVVSAAGWDGRAARWPQRANLPRLPKQIPDGACFHLPDTFYPERLRDEVRFAHLLGRRL